MAAWLLVAVGLMGLVVVVGLVAIVLVASAGSSPARGGEPHRDGGVQPAHPRSSPTGDRDHQTPSA